MRKTTLAGILCAALFAILLCLVTVKGALFGSAVLGLDEQVKAFALEHNSWRTFWINVTFWGGAWGIAIVTLVAVVLLWPRKREVERFLAAVGIATILNATLKLGIHRVRPGSVSSTAAAQSFPSGHALLATAAFGMLFALLWLRLRGWKRYAALALPLVAVLVGISRIMLNVHWLTDVIGGMLVGVTVILLVPLALGELDRDERGDRKNVSRVHVPKTEK